MTDTSTFLIHNPRQITHNLLLLFKNKCLVSVHFGGDAFFLTAILNIDEKNNTIIFDVGPKEVLNQQLLNATSVNFQAEFTGIKVSFKGSALKKTLYKGESAFTMLIPESLFWQQRREFFRIVSPQSKSSFCQLIQEGQEPVDLMLYDMSLMGFSVLNTSAKISSLLAPDVQFEQCRLVLSDIGEGVISFRVCSKLIMNPDKIDTLKIQKIGCMFTKVTPLFQTTIQKYVNQLQRESIQKTRG